MSCITSHNSAGAVTYLSLSLIQELINGYLCVCEVGWTGEMCSVNIDDCATNSCQNGGTCFVSSRAVVRVILALCYFNTCPQSLKW